MNKIKLFAKWGFIKSKKSRFILKGWNNKILHLLSIIVPSLLFICFGTIIFEFGFKPFWSNHEKVTFWLRLLLIIVSLLLFIRIMLELLISKKIWVRIFNVAGWFFLIFITWFVIPENLLCKIPRETISCFINCFYTQQ